MQIEVTKSPRPSIRFAQWAVAVVAAVAVPTVPALAQSQLVIADVTYTATTANTTDSHYRIAPNAGTPTNWRVPVDYASGTAYVKFEVISKPGLFKTLYNVCFEGNQAACMGYPPAYMTTGTYEFSYAFSTFWQYSVVDWSKGIKQIALILKDQNQNKVQGDNRFYPTTIHVVITLVPPGATYVSPDLSHDAGSSEDAGAADAGATSDAGGTQDASLQPDAGEPRDATSDNDAPASPDMNVSGDGQVEQGGESSEVDAATPQPEDAAMMVEPLVPQAGAPAIPVATSGAGETAGVASPAPGQNNQARMITLHGADGGFIPPPRREPTGGCSTSGSARGASVTPAWFMLLLGACLRIRRIPGAGGRNRARHRATR